MTDACARHACLSLQKIPRDVLCFALVWSFLGMVSVAYFASVSSFKGTLFTLVLFLTILVVLSWSVRLKNLAQASRREVKHTPEVKVEVGEDPPAYEVVIKADEAPPPAYYELFHERLSASRSYSGSLGSGSYYNGALAHDVDAETNTEALSSGNRGEATSEALVSGSYNEALACSRSSISYSEALGCAIYDEDHTSDSYSEAQDSLPLCFGSSPKSWSQTVPDSPGIPKRDNFGARRTKSFEVAVAQKKFFGLKRRVSLNTFLGPDR